MFYTFCHVSQSGKTCEKTLTHTNAKILFINHSSKKVSHAKNMWGNREMFLFSLFLFCTTKMFSYIVIAKTFLEAVLATAKTGTAEDR